LSKSPVVVEFEPHYLLMQFIYFFVLVVVVVVVVVVVHFSTAVLFRPAPANVGVIPLFCTSRPYSANRLSISSPQLFSQSLNRWECELLSIAMIRVFSFCLLKSNRASSSLDRTLFVISMYMLEINPSWMATVAISRFMNLHTSRTSKQPGV
jgi:hypothetical protein